MTFLSQKQKSAGYYRTRANELDTKLLQVVPDCPRTAKQSTFFSTFDWNLLTATTPIEELIKKPDNVFGNTTEREHTKPPPEKLKAESSEKINDFNDNREAVSEENNNKPPVKKVNIKKHVKEIKQSSMGARSPSPEKRERSLSPQKMISVDNEERMNGRNSPEKRSSSNNNMSPQKESRSLSPQKMNGHAMMDKHKSFEVLEVTQSPKKPNEQPKRALSHHAAEETENHTRQNEEIHPRRVPSRQDTEESPPKRAPSRQNDEYNSRRAGSRQEMRNGSSHRYLESPAAGSEGVIEGIVDGVNEVETLNEQGQDATDDSDPKERDAEISAMVEAGNMEQLAAVVLNGEGDRLVGQHSDNAELQSFLENVPVYMVLKTKLYT